MHHGQHLVRLEDLLILLHKRLEFVHVSLLHAVDDLEVRVEGLLKIRLVKHLPWRNFTHQKINNHQQLLNCQPKTESSSFRSFSEGLNETGLGFGVFELDCLGVTDVVEVPRELIIGHILGETHSWLSTHLHACESMQILAVITPNYNVHCCCLTYLVLVQTTLFVCFEHERSEFEKFAQLFVGNGDKVVGFGADGIKRSSVDSFDSLKDEVAKFLCIFEVSFVDEFHQEQHIQEKLDFSMLRHLSSPRARRVQFILNRLAWLQLSWLTWQS